MDQRVLQSGIRELEKRGYSAVLSGDRIIVKDPVFSCGTGPDAGRLLLTGHVDRVLTSGNTVTKFLYDRC